MTSSEGNRAAARPLHEDPSAWSHRLPAAGLACLGVAVATYLLLFQVGAIGAVWEPLTGDGSRRVLTSSLAAALPIPDAGVGAAAYALEAVLLVAGGAVRWRRRPWLVLSLGLVAAGVAAGGVALVAVQAFVIGAFCTLCLASAAISMVLFGLAIPEVRASVRHVRHALDRGTPARTAIGGRPPARTPRALHGARSDHT
jgi:uncharacterized membrane protein